MASIRENIGAYAMPGLIGTGVLGPMLFCMPGIFMAQVVQSPSWMNRPAALGVIGMAGLFVLAGLVVWACDPLRSLKRLAIIAPAAACLGLGVLWLRQVPPDTGSPPMRVPWPGSQSSQPIEPRR